MTAATVLFVLCCAKLSLFKAPMLIELRLENYAVIDNLVVEFGPGLNLLTGETGAGKSILIDALALLLGEKASSDVIRTGANRAVVSAVFESEGDCRETTGEDSGGQRTRRIRRWVVDSAARDCLRRQGASLYQQSARDGGGAKAAGAASGDHSCAE